MTQPPTIITLTVPAPGEDGQRTQQRTTLLIQRGSLAHLRQFEYNFAEDLINAIREAHDSLGAIEANPPVIADAPPELTKSSVTTSKSPAGPTEPMLTVPAGKRTVEIPVRNLQLAQTDELSQEQAVQIASKLIGGGLWDGQSPIHIADTTRTLKKMKHLSEKEMKLFALTDFVESGLVHEATGTQVDAAIRPGESAPTLHMGDTVRIRGGATDTDGVSVPFNEGIIEEFDYDSGPPRAWVSAGDHDVWVSVLDIAPASRVPAE